ncbi:DUF2089 family protein [uncultured Desulfobacter sp.]|uniref:DUF2089 family protein n=1 Tax=uncultured Desulfobacter sp. TaxID=240139 RepID=UPI002AAB83DE|nr:DUF2089 family protein [uncultured Desulfobacter sp.]
MSKKQFPVRCPSCKGLLAVQGLACSCCDTTVNGHFDLPILARLSQDDQDFIVRLVEASGSLKELARMYGISYPTVRNRVDALIEKISQMKKETQSKEVENE